MILLIKIRPCHFSLALLAYVVVVVVDRQQHTSHVYFIQIRMKGKSNFLKEKKTSIRLTVYSVISFLPLDAPERHRMARQKKKKENQGVI